jgi:hypothetical protein
MTRHLGRPSRKITLSVSPSWRRLLWVKMRLGMYSTALRCQIFPCICLKCRRYRTATLVTLLWAALHLCIYIGALAIFRIISNRSVWSPRTSDLLGFAQVRTRASVVRPHTISDYINRELRNSLDTIRLETDKQAGHHQQLAQQIRTDLEGQAAAFSAKQAHHKKNYQSAIEKEFRTKQNQESHVNKAREKYEADCLRINSYTAQSTLVQGKDLEKVQLKLERAQLTVQANERDFANFAKVLQDTVQKWEQNWKEFCDICQDLEEERLEFMKDNMWAFANAVSTVCVHDDEVYFLGCGTVSKSNHKLPITVVREDTPCPRANGTRKGHGKLCQGLRDGKSDPRPSRIRQLCKCRRHGTGTIPPRHPSSAVHPVITKGCPSRCHAANTRGTDHQCCGGWSWKQQKRRPSTRCHSLPHADAYQRKLPAAEPATSQRDCCQRRAIYVAAHQAADVQIPSRSDCGTYPSDS